MSVLQTLESVGLKQTVYHFSLSEVFLFLPLNTSVSRDISHLRHLTHDAFRFGSFISGFEKHFA
jgi:hypothetical protein